MNAENLGERHPRGGAGRTVTGWPDTDRCRGRAIAEGGAVTAEPGNGTLIRRG